MLLFSPFLFPGTKALDVAARICIFMILVASYDLMLGYTGIVSFAHTMFFGIGAYGVAIMLAKGWSGWTGVIVLGTLTRCRCGSDNRRADRHVEFSRACDLLFHDHACDRRLSRRSSPSNGGL